MGEVQKDKRKIRKEIGHEIGHETRPNSPILSMDMHSGEKERIENAL